MKNKNLIILLFLLNSTLLIAQSTREISYTLIPSDSLKLIDNGKEILLFNCEQFRVGSKGNVFINNPNSLIVFKFSKTGELIKKFGGKGNGPGEFEFPYNMEIAPSGNVFMYNPLLKKSILFSNKGEYLQQKFHNKNFQLWMNVNFISETTIAAEINMDNDVRKDGINYNEIFMAIIDLNDYKLKIINGPIYNALEDFSIQYTNVISANNKIYFGYKSINDYKIFVCNYDGQMIKEIVREIDKIKITGEKRADFEKMMERRKQVLGSKFGIKKFEDQLPYYTKISRLAVDHYGNLWVFNNKGKNEDKLHVDLYDKDGKYTKSFYFVNKNLGKQRTNSLLINNGFLYAYLENGDSGGNVYKYVIPKGIYSN